jgi:hypothetical protein
MSDEIIDLLSALHDGTMSLDEVAEHFRRRSWPRREASEPSTYLEFATRSQEDPDPYLPGSFDDVAAAYHRGELSNDQYEVLAQAMAESMRTKDQMSSEEPSE